MAKKKRKKQAAGVKSKPQKKKVSHSVKTSALAFVPEDLVFSFWKRYGLASLALFILSFAIYVQSLPYDFVLDDKIVIVDNNFTKKGFAGIWDIFTTESFTGYFGEQKDLVAGARYRPLSIVSFAIEHGIIGNTNSRVSHFINILLYGLCGILFLRVLSLCFPKLDHRWFLSLPFLIALIWIAHPIHTEAVANIKGRDEIMAMIGSLGALFYCLRFIDKGKYWRLILAALCFFLGILSKETTVTFLGIIPLSLFVFRDVKLSDLVKTMLPIAVIFVLYIIIRYQVIGYLFGQLETDDLMNDPFLYMNGGEKFATIFFTLLKYLGLSVFPHPLTHDYYPFHIPTMTFGNIWVILSVLLHVGLGIFALLGLRKKSVLAYGILFYLMALSIVSNIFFAVGTFMNERFIFMASAGSTIAFIYLLREKLGGLNFAQAKNMSLVLIGIIAIGFSVRSFTRTPVWASATSLNTSAVKVSKNSARANIFMGTALFNEYKAMSSGPERTEKLKLAEGYVNRSFELFPNYHNACLMKAGIATEMYKVHGNFETMLSEIETAASYRPGVPYIHQYCEYMNERPSGKTNSLINFYHRLGYHKLLLGKRDAKWALKYLNYGYQLDNNNPAMNFAIGKAYEMLGRTEEATQFLGRAQALGYQQ